MVLLASSGGNRAAAWDEEGHVIVTRLAHHSLPERMPDWVRSEAVASRLAYFCDEPDRWRGQHSIDLDHCNNADHYIDLEQLAPYDLTIQTIPPLRREFTDLLATVRARHPDRFPKYDREKDKDYTHLVPGLLPYEIAEMQWKLAGSWTTLKTFEKERQYVSDEMIENARLAIVIQMGLLSHYVGDGSQPLHVTIHHHGWSGDNPNGYTTDKKFHAEIDGGIIRLNHITPESLMDRAKAPHPVSRDQYFKEICGYLDQSLKFVEPLYQMEKSGDLKRAPGKKLVEDRLVEGGSMLAGIWIAAYDSAVIDEFRVRQLIGNNNAGSKEKPAKTPG